MKPKSALMLRVLMNRYHQGAPDVFLSGLSKEEAGEVISQKVSSQDPSQAVLAPVELLRDKIHYSWLVPGIKTFKQPLRSLLISSMPERTAGILSKTTSSQIVDVPSPIVQKFLFDALMKELNFSEILPEAFLPETAFKPLLTLKKKDLVDLIDLLGMYDLAPELRQIIDKSIIKEVYAILPKMHQRFLKICLHQKEQLLVPQMGLKNWRGDKKKLLRVLHRRGLQRLGGALSGQSSDLIWHIVHRLDNGRGVLLEKTYRKNEIAGATSILTQQVLNVVNFKSKWGEREKEIL